MLQRRLAALPLCLAAYVLLRPAIPVQLSPPVDRLDARSDAPVIVAGIVMADDRVGRRGGLQLRRLRLRVENVLRSEAERGPLTVYYFTFAGAFNGPQPLGMWNIGGRRIFWLRPDAGVLRTACDGWDSCTWGMYSGAHPEVGRDAGRSTDDLLSEIALTRGEGRIDNLRFAGSVLRGAPVPDALFVEKCRQLARTESGGVKAAACTELWIFAHDPQLRMAAEEGMRAANCRCRESIEGEPDCGQNSILDDPPY